jgi:hypothetical protein
VKDLTDVWIRSKSTLNYRKQEERHQSLVGKIQERYFCCMQRLAAVAAQGKELLDLTSCVL